ncbi:MAG: FtsB family cell division protein [Gemmatimonadaceae bacterium]
MGAVWFAVQGSEYGTTDIIRQHREQRRLTREVDSLKRVVDSLRVHKQRVLNDPRMQERVAREEFGMVRGRELLYRLVEPDSL